MTNSAKMSLEERLVQHIKDVGLGALIDDEDAITELTRRAVQEALFQPVRIKQDYGRVEEKDSPVVAAARVIAREAIKKLVEAEVERMAAEPATMTAIRSAIALTLPQIITDAARSLDRTIAQAGANMAIEHLRNAGLMPR